jgi:hypothetical protein
MKANTSKEPSGAAGAGAAAILKRVAFLMLFFSVLGIHTYLVESKPLVGMAGLVVLVVTVPGIDPFVLWCLYSVVYWACDLPREDSFVLLAATTLFFAAIDLAEEWLPNSLLNKHRATLTLVSKLVAVLPVPCNNLLLHPGWGLVRASFYLTVAFAKKREVPSALFSKSESFVVLVCWHFAVEAAASRFRPLANDSSDSDLPVFSTPNVEILRANRTNNNRT